MRSIQNHAHPPCIPPNVEIHKGQKLILVFTPNNGCKLYFSKQSTGPQIFPNITCCITLKNLQIQQGFPYAHVKGIWFKKTMVYNFYTLTIKFHTTSFSISNYQIQNMVDLLLFTSGGLLNNNY